MIQKIEGTVTAFLSASGWASAHRVDCGVGSNDFQDLISGLLFNGQQIDQLRQNQIAIITTERKRQLSKQQAVLVTDVVA